MESDDGIKPSSENQFNFTPRAQQVLSLARKESVRLQHSFVGTEHLLLGLLALGQGVAVNVLQKLGLYLNGVRQEVERLVEVGVERQKLGDAPYTPRAKKALSLAVKEAASLNHTYVGTEHVLLGLLREGGGVAARLMQSLDVNLEETRKAILKELDPNYVPAAEAASSLVASPPESPQPSKGVPNDVIDTSQRYDIYCGERNMRMMVYRNALFKGRRKLLAGLPSALGVEFWELEQANGQSVFVPLHSVIKFCPHGTELAGEIIPPTS